MNASNEPDTVENLTSGVKTHLDLSKKSEEANVLLLGQSPTCVTFFNPYFVRALHDRMHQQNKQDASNPKLNLRMTTVDEVSGGASTIFGPEAKRELRSFSELRIGCRVKNATMSGVICVESFKTVSVSTVMQCNDGSWIRLMIYKAVPIDADSLYVTAAFPLGARIIVNEPYLKRFADGTFGVRIDNPQDFQLELPSPAKGEIAQATRELGNDLVGKGDLMGARMVYTKCLAMTPSDILAMSNRAEVHLKMNNWRSALRDADAALALLFSSSTPVARTPMTEAKTHRRRARALLELGLYSAAVDASERSIESLRLCESGEKVIKLHREFLDEARTLDSQQKTGIYDWNKIFRVRARDGRPPRLADYCGSVAVRCDEDGNRCLKTTREVAEGELLVVCNPLARSHIRRGDVSGWESTSVLGFESTAKNGRCSLTSQIDTLSELIRRATEDAWVLQAAYSLSDGFASTPCTLARTAKIPVVPRNDDDIYDSQYEPHITPLDVNRLRRIIGANVFGVPRAGFEFATTITRKEKDDDSSLYFFPSFANHSCVPNAERTLIGDVMVLRANKPLRAGEEITLSYGGFGIETLVDTGRAFLNNWGFICRCELCLCESRNEIVLKSLRQRITARMTSIHLRGGASRYEAFKSLANEVDNALKRINDSVLTTREVQLLKYTMFTPVYAGIQESLEAMGRIKEAIQAQDVLLSLTREGAPMTLLECTALMIFSRYATTGVAAGAPLHRRCDELQAKSARVHQLKFGVNGAADVALVEELVKKGSNALMRG